MTGAARRTFMRHLLGVGAAALLLPLNALAAAWNAVAFGATTRAGALEGLGVKQTAPSRAIEIIAPDFAENGAVVQIEVKSHIAATDAIAVMVEKNPIPLIANFMFSEQMVPAVVLRIKVAESARLEVIVRAGGQYYSASRNVEVSLSGCE